MQFIKTSSTYSETEAVGSKYLTILLNPTPIALLAFIAMHQKINPVHDAPISVYYPDLDNNSDYALEALHLGNVISMHFPHVTMYFDKSEVKAAKSTSTIPSKSQFVAGSSIRSQTLNAIFNIAKRVTLSGEASDGGFAVIGDRNIYLDIELVTSGGLILSKELIGLSVGLAEVFGTGLTEVPFDKFTINKYIKEDTSNIKALLQDVEKQIAMARFGLIDPASKKKR